MFVSDFLFLQGVLVVDTAPINANHAVESSHADEFNFCSGNFLQEGLLEGNVLPGDAPVLKFQKNAMMQVLPGDAPVLKP